MDTSNPGVQAGRDLRGRYAVELGSAHSEFRIRRIFPILNAGIPAAFVFCLASLSVIQARADVMDETKLPPPAQVKVDFLKDIQPLLEGHCLKCHSGEKPKSNFRLNTREAALRGG